MRTRFLIRRLLHRLLALVALGLLSAAAFLWGPAQSSHQSVWSWAPAPKRWAQGDCEHCHRPQEQVFGQGHDDPDRAARPTTTSNSGATPMGVTPSRGSAVAWCVMSSSSCESCHGRAPATHTSQFTCPSNNSPGAVRHALLGRIRPASCLVCHRSFVSSCSGCHHWRETRDWTERAVEQLAGWPEILDSLAVARRSSPGGQER